MSNLEKDLVAAGERLLEAMKVATPQEMELLRSMGGEINKWYEEEQAHGRYVDRSALFAAGIIVHDGLHSGNLRDAAKQYLQIDHMFVKEQSAV